MRVDLARKAFKDLYVNKGLRWYANHFDWFVKTYADSLRRCLEKRSFTIIGDIEEREVEI